MLFHVSEDRGIERFEPRQLEGGGASVVWAIDADRLRNYLVPRDCPRVTYYAGPATTAADRERFLASGTAVVAIEASWYGRLQSCRLYCYHLPPDTFECIDECAGYFVSPVAVAPTSVAAISDPINQLARLGVELRVLPNLWPLRDAVVVSTMRFSIIRMRKCLAEDSGLTSAGAVGVSASMAQSVASGRRGSALELGGQSQ